MQHIFDDVIFVPIVSKLSLPAAETDLLMRKMLSGNMKGRFPVPAKILMGYTWQGCSYKIMDAEGSSMEPIYTMEIKVLFVEYCERRRWGYCCSLELIIAFLSNCKNE